MSPGGWGWGLRWGWRRIPFHTPHQTTLGESPEDPKGPKRTHSSLKGLASRMVQQSSFGVQDPVGPSSLGRAQSASRYLTQVFLPFLAPDDRGRVVLRSCNIFALLRNPLVLVPRFSMGAKELRTIHSSKWVEWSNERRLSRTQTHTNAVLGPKCNPNSATCVSEIPSVEEHNSTPNSVR